MECTNCGYPEGLHHFDTMQCPKNGESLMGQKQEYLGTIYVPNNSDELNKIKRQLDSITKRLEVLENKEE